METPPPRTNSPLPLALPPRARPNPAHVFSFPDFRPLPPPLKQKTRSPQTFRGRCVFRLYTGTTGPPGGSSAATALAGILKGQRPLSPRSVTPLKQKTQSPQTFRGRCVFRLYTGTTGPLGGSSAATALAGILKGQRPLSPRSETPLKQKNAIPPNLPGALRFLSIYRHNGAAGRVQRRHSAGGDS